MMDDNIPQFPAHLAGDAWRAADGDYNHLLRHDLNADSVVFDIGGFKGDFTDRIHSKYGCKVYIFEPIKEYYDFINGRFYGNDRIKTFNYGFTSTRRVVEVVMSDSSTSEFNVRTGDRIESIRLLSFKEFLFDFDKIDLAEINIEGSEYDLLESLEATDLKKMCNIQVQFHDFVPNCEERRDKIREKLSLTHELTYDYAFVWENWRVKP